MSGCGTNFSRNVALLWLDTDVPRVKNRDFAEAIKVVHSRVAKDGCKSISWSTFDNMFYIQFHLS